MRKKKYCPFCATPLIQKEHEGRVRDFCTQCNEALYQNPVPASAVVVVNDRKHLLLVKRSVEPKKGWWCLPGGFMELGEEPYECALRELEEEASIKGKISDLLGVVSADNSLYGNVLMMGYSVEEYTGEPAPGDDALEVGFFPPEDLPEIAFGSHRKFIRIFYAGYCPA